MFVSSDDTTPSLRGVSNSITLISLNNYDRSEPFTYELYHLSFCFPMHVIASLDFMIYVVIVSFYVKSMIPLIPKFRYLYISVDAS